MLGISKKIVKDGVLLCDIPYRCWDSHLCGYYDTVIPSGEKVKVSFRNSLPIDIKTMVKNSLLGSYIHLDVAQYSNCVRLV